MLRWTSHRCSEYQRLLIWRAVDVGNQAAQRPMMECLNPAKSTPCPGLELAGMLLPTAANMRRWPFSSCEDSLPQRSYECHFTYCYTFIDLRYCHYSFIDHLKHSWSTQQLWRPWPQHCSQLCPAAQEVSTTRIPL